jgi:hypothetical protein
MLCSDVSGCIVDLNFLHPPTVELCVCADLSDECESIIYTSYIVISLPDSSRESVFHFTIITVPVVCVL